MSRVRRQLEQYLALRRGLGFELRNVQWVLGTFVRFLKAEGASHITTELALRWATLPVGVQPATWAWRLGTVRRFAIWSSTLDPRTEIPPEGLLPFHYRRQRPYIYSDSEIRRLVQAASGLTSPRGLRGWSYSTLFGLFAVSGMRLSEALFLDRDDVDLAAGVLSIRKTKSGQSRLVHVHPSTREALKAYTDARDRLVPLQTTRAFFVSERGAPITRCMAEWTFAQVSRSVGLRPPGKGHGTGPRLHDMRHRFAVRTLIEWYRAGLDVDAEIPKLATYLGHRQVRDTYWYLEAVPELLQLATKRLERSKPRGSRR
jgi:integrase